MTQMKNMNWILIFTLILLLTFFFMNKMEINKKKFFSNKMMVKKMKW